MNYLRLTLVFFVTAFFSLNLSAQETININERFTAGEEHSYSFYLSTTQSLNPVSLLIYGTDYDYDNDGDFTDFGITVNGKELIYAKDLVQYGLGKNGTKNQIKLDISKLIKRGTNTIVLKNTENSDQRDYNYIAWIKILTSGVSNTTTSTTPISLNEQKYIAHKFTCKTKRSYTFYVSDLSSASDAQLVLNGYDYDYDHDGDYTDFGISINGHSLFNAKPLYDKGFGANGNSKSIRLKIGTYLKQGNNEIVLENTEITGQTDYAYINSIMVKAGTSNVVSNISVNSPVSLNMRFNSQSKIERRFYITNPNEYDAVRLKVYGTDVDQDKDGDYTDFSIKINSNTLVDIKPLANYGIGKNGNYNYAVFDIKQYLSSGNNTLILKNTEELGQVDYTYIKTIEIEANKMYATNDPPVIVVTKPQIERGFKIVAASTLSVEGIASDDDGIAKVLINNTIAQLSSNGLFSAQIPVAAGNNRIRIVATDNKGVSATKDFTIDIGAGTQVTSGTQLTNTGKYYALIIGVSEYDDPKIPDLMGEPTKDARTLFNILTQKYTFETQNVKLLINPSYRQVIRSFDDFAKKVGEEDNFLIFYAGHGNWDENSEVGYWLPKDAELGYTDAWLYNSVLVDNIRKVNSKHTLLLADACFSGGIFKTRSLLQGASKSIQKKYELKSRNAITSGTLKTVPNKSVFFKYLSDRLQTNTQKYLSASELFSRIEIPVGNNSPNTPQFGDIKNVGDEGGDFIFIKR